MEKNRGSFLESMMVYAVILTMVVGFTYKFKPEYISWVKSHLQNTDLSSLEGMLNSANEIDLKDIDISSLIASDKFAHPIYENVVLVPTIGANNIPTEINTDVIESDMSSSESFNEQIRQFESEHFPVKLGELKFDIEPPVQIFEDSDIALASRFLTKFDQILDIWGPALSDRVEYVHISHYINKPTVMMTIQGNVIAVPLNALYYDGSTKDIFFQGEKVLTYNINHEIFHVLAGHPIPNPVDEQIASANYVGFNYVGLGDECNRVVINNLVAKGTVTAYQSCAKQEDFAEMGTNLVSGEEYRNKIITVLSSEKSYPEGEKRPMHEKVQVMIDFATSFNIDLDAIYEGMKNLPVE